MAGKYLRDELGYDEEALQSAAGRRCRGDGRDFVIIRAGRGGTAGLYNQSDSTNNNGQNTLSQRYDDLCFVQNITRSTAAGLLISFLQA